MKAARARNGRSQRVLAWLVELGRPATMREIRDSIEPDATTAIMSGTVHTLVRTKKVTCHTRLGSPHTYSAGKDALRDLRKAKTPAAPAKPKLRPLRIKPLPAAMTAPTFQITPRQDGQAAALRTPSEQIAADVEAFLARGGKIETLPHGASAYFERTTP